MTLVNSGGYFTRYQIGFFVGSHNFKPQYGARTQLNPGPEEKCHIRRPVYQVRKKIPTRILIRERKRRLVAWLFIPLAKTRSKIQGSRSVIKG